MSRNNFVSIILFVVALHIAIVVLFCSRPIFASDQGRLNPIYFPEATIRKMDKLNMPFTLVRNIIQNGSRLPTSQPYVFIYIHKGSCAVLDESTVQVTNVIKHSCVVPQ